MAQLAPLIINLTLGVVAQMGATDTVKPVNLGTSTPGTDTFLRGDGAWSNVLTGGLLVSGGAFVAIGNVTLGASGTGLDVEADTISWPNNPSHGGDHTFIGTVSLSNALAVSSGGTGRATATTAYGLLAAGTTATGAHQTLAAGATTEILVGGGASALPVWTTATGSGAPVRATSPTLAGTVGIGVTGDLGGLSITGSQNNIGVTIANSASGAGGTFHLMSTATGSGYAAGRFVIAESGVAVRFYIENAGAAGVTGDFTVGGTLRAGGPVFATNIDIDRTGAEAAIRLQEAGTNVAQIRALSSGGLRVTNGAVTADWLRFDSAGTAGFGVTPGAWDTGTGSKAIQVGDRATLSCLQSGTTTHLSNNSRFDGTNWKYIETATAAFYAQSSGAHLWGSAASGTAGGTVTYITTLTLNASGALVMGTTQPIMRGVDNSLITVNGGASAGDGGFAEFYGNAHASLAGAFKLYAKDGSGHTLTGLPAGSLEWSGVYFGPDGTASAPTYSFSSVGSSDNGMYLSAANTVAFAAAGGLVASFASSTTTFTAANVLWSGNPTHTGTHTFSGNISAANVTSSTYTPTRVNIANVTSSTANAAFYSRVGNDVRVKGTISVDPTSAGSLTTITLTLPVASNLGTAGDLVGMCCHDQGNNSCGWVTGRAVGDTAELNFVAQSSTAGVLHYDFSYRVI